MEEPKRTPLKGKLSPRHATTFNEICSLETDHIDTRNAWLSITEKRVSIVRQKRGEKPTAQIELTRQEFEKFIDWYNKKQKTFL